MNFITVPPTIALSVHGMLQHTPCCNNVVTLAFLFFVKQPLLHAGDRDFPCKRICSTGKCSRRE